ncbi:hypothetical protein B0H10DRAFT_1319374 [Mycena sp. CBHHK59/15]|nr:hypothetical protein B0H10DRAFT_1319374 [Mycena sp. CBHHK59/15]
MVGGTRCRIFGLAFLRLNCCLWLPAHTLPRPRHGRSQRGCRGCAPHSGCCQYCQRTCLVNNDGTLPTLIVHQIGGRPFTLHSIPPPPPLCLL